MYCRYCGRELEEGNPVCAACGEVTPLEDSGKPAKQKWYRRPWVMVTACAVALGILVGGWYLLNGGWLPRKNTVTYRDSYSVTQEQAAAKGDTVVAVLGDRTLTNGQLQVYYWMQLVDFVDLYGDYLGTYFTLDLSKPLDAQTVDESGITWQQYFLEAALHTWQRYQSLCIAAENAGFPMDEAYGEYLQELRTEILDPDSQAYETYSFQLLRQQMGDSCTVDDYLRYLEDYYYGFQYFESEYSGMRPAKEDVEAYFREHEAEYLEMGIQKNDETVVNIRHLLLSPEAEEDEQGDPVYTDAAWEACRAELEALEQQWLSDGGEEMTLAELTAEHSQDMTSAAYGGLYENVYRGYLGEGLDAFYDWCFSPDRQPGEHTLVRSNYGWHLVYFRSSSLRWYTQSETDLKTQRSNQWLDNLMNRDALEVTYRKIVLGTGDSAA